jgi:hypothetical protein
LFVERRFDSWGEIETRAKATQVIGSAVMYAAHATLQRGYSVESAQGHSYLYGKDYLISRFLESPASKAKMAHLVSGYRDLSGSRNGMLLSSQSLEWFNDQKPDWYDDLGTSYGDTWKSLANNTDPTTSDGLIFWADVCASFCVRRHDDESEFFALDFTAVNNDNKAYDNGKCSCYAYRDSDTTSTHAGLTSHVPPDDVRALQFLEHFLKIPITEPNNTHVYAMKRDLGESYFVPELQSTIYYKKLWERYIDMDTNGFAGKTELYTIRTLERCLAECAKDAVRGIKALATVRFDSAAPQSCFCFEFDLFEWGYDDKWERDDASSAFWYKTQYCEFTRPDESGRTLIYSKSVTLPSSSPFCTGSPVGGGYALTSSSVRESFHDGVSSAVRFAKRPDKLFVLAQRSLLCVSRFAVVQPFDVLCRERCDARGDCAYASVFAETWDYLNLAHARPPPPSPPSPPSPSPLPPPPEPPFPPGVPPSNTVGLRVFEPGVNQAPLETADGQYAATCAASGCGEGLPIFKASSSASVASAVLGLYEDGVFENSVCAYECTKTISRHSVSLDDFMQLMSTSTTPSSLLFYGRLSSVQNSDVENFDDVDQQFVSVQAVDFVDDVTMEDCHDYFETRKEVAMHAAWLVSDEGALPALGRCSLFQVARSSNQLTLWQSFFTHAHRVADAAQFSQSIVDSVRRTLATPPKGRECDPGLQGTLNDDGLDRNTEWRACFWWSEFDRGRANDLSCVPDKEGSNVMTPTKILHALRSAGLSYPPPSPPPPSSPQVLYSPPPPDFDFQCASGVLPKAPYNATGYSDTDPKCWQWTESSDAAWPPFSVHGDVYEEYVGGCRNSQQRRSRVVQWGSSFHQPDYGDAQMRSFSGPPIADCTSQIPDRHCCRVRTSFYISKTQPSYMTDIEDARYPDGPPTGDEAYWFGFSNVTQCERLCQLEHERTGSDTQCVPAQPECNTWQGENDPDIDFQSRFMLADAYCVCGMKLSAISQSARRRTQAQEEPWRWDDPISPTVDVVSGGHFRASDECAASSVKFLTDFNVVRNDSSCRLMEEFDYAQDTSLDLDVVYRMTETACAAHCSTVASSDVFSFRSTERRCRCIDSSGGAALSPNPLVNSGPVCFRKTGLCETNLESGEEKPYHDLQFEDLLQPLLSEIEDYQSCDSLDSADYFPNNELRHDFTLILKSMLECADNIKRIDALATTSAKDAADKCLAHPDCKYLLVRVDSAEHRSLEWTSFSECRSFKETTGTGNEGESVPFMLYQRGHLQASDGECCRVGRSDALSSRYHAVGTSSAAGTAPDSYFEYGSASSAFGPGVPFGISHESEMLFVFDFNLDGHDDVVIGNRIFMSGSPFRDDPGAAAEEDARHAWHERPHLGRPFANKPIMAMDAIISNPPTTELGWPVKPVLEGYSCDSGFADANQSMSRCPREYPICVAGACRAVIPYQSLSVMTAIAYSDHSVKLYAIERVPHLDAVSPDTVKLVWKADIADGSRGTPTSVSMFLEEVTDHIKRTRIGTLVTYSDADDLIFQYDQPSPANLLGGFLPTTSTVEVHARSKLSSDSPVPSLCSATLPIPTKQPYVMHGAPSPPPPPPPPPATAGRRLQELDSSPYKAVHRHHPHVHRHHPHAFTDQRPKRRIRASESGNYCSGDTSWYCYFLRQVECEDVQFEGACWTSCNCDWHSHRPHGHRPHGHDPHGHHPHTPHTHSPPPPSPLPPPPPLDPPPPTPPPFIGSLQWTQLFVVGTDASEPNKFYLTDTGRSERAIPFSDGENSAAVSLLRYYQHPRFYFSFCFANTNARNRCYSYEIDYTQGVNQVIPDLTNEDTVHTTVFGDANEFTIGIELVDLNGDGFSDISECCPPPHTLP